MMHGDMSSMSDHAHQSNESIHAHVHPHLRIYSRWSLIYWWPVWVVGYIMAFLTYMHGKPEQIAGIDQARERIHPSNNLGVIYLLVLFIVILIINCW